MCHPIWGFHITNDAFIIRSLWDSVTRVPFLNSTIYSKFGANSFGFWYEPLYMCIILILQTYNAFMIWSFGNRRICSIFFVHRFRLRYSHHIYMSPDLRLKCQIWCIHPFAYNLKLIPDIQWNILNILKIGLSLDVALLM